MLRLTWKRVIGVLAGLASVVGGMCHGYLAEPAARNVQRNSDYCPHCLSGPEVCGDPAGQHHHEAFGKYGSSPRVKTFTAGGVLSARVLITTNHMGRWSLELCRLRNPSPSFERLALRRGCFKKLKLTKGGTYVYLSPSASSSVATFRLPRGSRCRRCVLRWVWETGNSCTPRGTPRRYAGPGLSPCGKYIAGERFTNCADIRIR